MFQSLSCLYLQGREALLKALQGKQPLRTEEKSPTSQQTPVVPTSMYTIHLSVWLQWSYIYISTVRSFSHPLISCFALASSHVWAVYWSWHCFLLKALHICAVCGLYFSCSLDTSFISPSHTFLFTSLPKPMCFWTKQVQLFSWGLFIWLAFLLMIAVYSVLKYFQWCMCQCCSWLLLQLSVILSLYLLYPHFMKNLMLLALD